MEEIELSMACLKAGWGWLPEYDSLSRDEFLLRAESLIAHHENRAANSERCLQQLRPLIAEVTALFEELATQRTGSLERNQELAVLMRLIAQTNERYFGAIGDIYPLLIALERGHVQYFRSLKATGAAGVSQTLMGESERLAKLERRILTRFQENAAGRIDEAELYHAMAPSAKTAARVTHLKVHAVLHAVLGKFNQLDAPPDPRKLQGLGQEVAAVTFLVYEAASNQDTRAAVPAVAASYESVLRYLKCLEEAVQGYAVDVSKLSSGPRDDLAALIRQSSNAFARLIAPMDTEMSVIDRILR